MNKKRVKTRTTQPSTALSRHKTGFPSPDEAGGDTPHKLALAKAEEIPVDLQQAFVTTNKDLAVVLAFQVAATLGEITGGPVIHNSTRAAVHSLGARDGTEALLAVQMVGVHNLAMRYLANAAMKDQTSHGIELYVGHANRLLRTFTTQVETLKKYRSKGEQHCTVKHVHVHSGGQAVVGAVTTRGKDRGEGGERDGDQ